MNKQFHSLGQVLLNINTKEEMEDFLLGILTIQEYEELSKRLQIVTLLKKGLPQHKIASKLGVGIATVTRGSKELAKGRFKNI